MPNYEYKAMDDQGFTSTGRVEVLNKKELETYLNERGLFLVSCSRGNMNFKLLNFGVRLKDIIIFSRQFSILISAGIPLDEAIKTLSGFTNKPKLSSALKEIEMDLGRGIALSEAMAKHHKVFKYFFISMIKVGEYSGELDTVLKRVAEFYEEEGKLSSKIRGALTYPIILVGMIVAIIAFLMTNIIPTFQDLFESLRIELPFLTQFLVDVSTFMRNYGIIMILIISAFVYMLSRYYKTESGRYRGDTLLLRLPVISTVYTKVQTARFARSMNILLGSGINIMQSFDIIDSLISNKVILERLRSCRESVSMGYSYSSSLEKMDFFPDIMINMIAVGEKTGSLPEVFDKVSDFFDDEANEAINNAVALVEPLMLMIAGAVILVIFLAIMLPMFDIMNNIS